MTTNKDSTAEETLREIRRVFQENYLRPIVGPGGPEPASLRPRGVQEIGWLLFSDDDWPEIGGL